MENLALTTILLLILALPGYLARRVYHSGNFNRAVLPQKLAKDLASAFILSLPLHFVAIFITEHLNEIWGLVPDIKFDYLFRIILGEFGQDSILLDKIIDNAYYHVHWIIGYFFSLLVISWGSGYFLRDIVWRNQLDLIYPNLFGFENPWIYRLTGRGGPGGGPNGMEFIPVVDALVNLGGERSRLYRGIVHDFVTDESGTLKEIYLIDAVRGVFWKNNEGEEVFDWEDIPGQTFVLKYETVLNLNITYLDQDDPEFRQERGDRNQDQE